MNLKQWKRYFKIINRNDLVKLIDKELKKTNIIRRIIKRLIN